jgi:hypothetical protein
VLEQDKYYFHHRWIVAMGQLHSSRTASLVVNLKIIKITTCVPFDVVCDGRTRWRWEIAIVILAIS